MTIATTVLFTRTSKSSSSISQQSIKVVLKRILISHMLQVVNRYSPQNFQDYMNSSKRIKKNWGNNFTGSALVNYAVPRSTVLKSKTIMGDKTEISIGDCFAGA